MALLMFYGTECHFCHDMMPLVDKLEKEEKVKVQRVETWHNSANNKKLQDVDNGKCGGVPFFYNEETKKWICGATSYDKLKKWALGK